MAGYEVERLAAFHIGVLPSFDHGPIYSQPDARKNILIAHTNRSYSAREACFLGHRHVLRQSFRT